MIFFHCMRTNSELDRHSIRLLGDEKLILNLKLQVLAYWLPSLHIFIVYNLFISFIYVNLEPSQIHLEISMTIFRNKWYQYFLSLTCQGNRSFMVPWFLFTSLSHFKFIFVYGVRMCSNFTDLPIVQLSNHHLMKRLSFSHCTLLLPFS